MKATTKKHHQKTQTELARDYRVDPRTILRWKEAGAPIHDPQAMVGWIEGHRSGTRHEAHGENLPDGMEHSNFLRLTAETAASWFCYEACEALVTNLIEDLLENGMDPHKARGTGIMVWYGMLYQLKGWTMRDRFNAVLKKDDSSLDKNFRALMPGWTGKSQPPTKFPRQLIPESVRKALLANGAKQVLRYADISGEEGGLKMSDKEQG